MRKFLTLLAMTALAGCGGGGGANTAPNPNPPAVATTTPQGNLVTPTFTLNLGGKTGASTSRDPRYIDGANTLSVKITLVSNNGTPTTVTNPSVTTDVNGTSGTPCNPTCTVSGPPSPPGTDRYTVTTYDATGGGGNALSLATKDFTIVAGSANTGLSITLFGVVKTFALSGVTSPNAGTTPADSTLTVTVKNAAGGTITGTYGDNSTGAGYISGGGLNGTPVTISINETNANGATLVASGGATQNSTTSVTLHNDTDVVKLHYAGLAENSKTFTIAATGATTNTSSTFQPTLQAITPSSGTEIDLYVDSTTGGTGSTGSQTFTEAGFTGAPYNQSFTWTFTPTSGFVTPCSQIATITPASGTGGGVFTATAPTAATPPAAGSCDLVINDNLTQGGHTQTAKTVVTYTTSSVSASKHNRKQN
ncbi:MAG: hypothetical protein QOF71_602 [Candidatus Eremiobacteraeota bacterium]|jgi:hypothetical protein|nr:hypothetical protein [Candidatus Eremiobacteraeota bacterium]